MNPTFKDTKDTFLNFLQDFKNFSLKSTALDMALGIIIGTAFTKIISSLVNDIILPPIGLMLGGIHFVDLKFILKDAVLDKNGNVIQSAVTINYGQFLQVLIDFIVIALCVFIALQFLQKIFDRRIEGEWQNYIKK